MRKVEQSLQIQAKKPYEKPSVVYEARLEAQAGSPIDGTIDLLDLTGTSR